ncbi:MAG: hypothetical protein AAFQ98_00115 [Bacteroidota bacterium]
MPRLLAVFGLLLVSINPPLLSIFNRLDFVGGFPVLYFYIFLVWIVVIVALARIVRTSIKETDPEEE